MVRVTTLAFPSRLWTRRFAQLLVGLLLYGLGLALVVRAGVGVVPWDVLTQGIQVRTGIPFGLAMVIISVVVLLLWIPLRERPGLGTVLNALLIGPAAELGLWMFPQQHEPLLQGVTLAGGITLVALATGMYIGAAFGPGPRDGLMTGLHRRTGVRIWIVRTALEVAVVAVGWVLGGQVGIGTVAFALLIGPMVGVALPLFDLRSRIPVKEVTR